ncbi:hypothetical protein CAEBREN_08420 [Caenorhabditis brenneri]|uniref:Uncharacterized protein n=1 Tax=Caenorhabditis brenneri TaxID=135651 RepID=G0M9L4_CAEBE|nr:hypothetical protein CAEBREN_08420 [Caenorhabditis brenneri]
MRDKDTDSEEEPNDTWNNTYNSDDSDDFYEEPDFSTDNATSQNGFNHRDGDGKEGSINDRSSQSTGEPPPPPRRSGIKRHLVPYDLMMNSTSDEEDEDSPYHPDRKAKKSPQKRRSKEEKVVVKLTPSSYKGSSGCHSAYDSRRDDTPLEIVEEKTESKSGVEKDKATEHDVQDPGVVVISDEEEGEEKIDYFPIRIFPPGTFSLPKQPSSLIVSPEFLLVELPNLAEDGQKILDGQPSLDGQAPSVSPEISPPSSEKPENRPEQPKGTPENPEESEEPEYYAVVDPQQIISLDDFQRVFIPSTFHNNEEETDQDKYIRKLFFEPTPPSPRTPSKTTEQLDKEELVYWQEANDPPEILEREKFRLIKITTRKRPLGKVVLTLQETVDSPMTVKLVEDHKAYAKVLEIGSYFLIEELILDMLKVQTEKYVNFLSESVELLPIRYLDWWNHKPIGTPNEDPGYQLNRFLERCDSKVLKKLRVRFDSWSFDNMTDIRENLGHWRNLREFKTNMWLPIPLQGCLHFNNFKIKVHGLNHNEWDKLLEAFRKKLPICPPPSFDIQTETDIIQIPFDDEGPLYDFPLYVHADMFTSSLHTLLVKIDKNSVSGRVIDKVKKEELPEIADWVFSDDFDKGYYE